MKKLAHEPSHKDGNLSHRPSHRDGNLSHRPSHADIEYIQVNDGDGRSHRTGLRHSALSHLAPG